MFVFVKNFTMCVDMLFPSLTNLYITVSFRFKQTKKTRWKHFSVSCSSPHICKVTELRGHRHKRTYVPKYSNRRFGNFLQNR